MITDTSDPLFFAKKAWKDGCPYIFSSYDGTLLFDLGNVAYVLIDKDTDKHTKFTIGWTLFGWHKAQNNKDSQICMLQAEHYANNEL